ncbi:hypothetical protein EVAR_22100_1, partial [Eumeta japonica]
MAYATSYMNFPWRESAGGAARGGGGGREPSGACGAYYVHKESRNSIVVVSRGLCVLTHSCI